MREEQFDEHVWAWRAYRFFKTGQMIWMDYSDGERRYIDPSDFYLS